MDYLIIAFENAAHYVDSVRDPMEAARGIGRLILLLEREQSRLAARLSIDSAPEPYPANAPLEQLVSMDGQGADALEVMGPGAYQGPRGLGWLCSLPPFQAYCMEQRHLEYHTIVDAEAMALESILLWTGAKEPADITDDRWQQLLQRIGEHWFTP